MPERIRLGFVGAGRMGQCAHLKNDSALSGQCEVVALGDLKVARDYISLLAK